MLRWATRIAELLRADARHMLDALPPSVDGNRQKESQQKPTLRAQPGHVAPFSPIPPEGRNSCGFRNRSRYSPDSPNVHAIKPLDQGCVGLRISSPECLSLARSLN